MASRPRAGSRRRNADVSHAVSGTTRAESGRTATGEAFRQIGNRARGVLLSGGRPAGKVHRQSDPRAPKPPSREEEREALERALPAIAQPIEAEGRAEPKGDGRAADDAMPLLERATSGRQIPEQTRASLETALGANLSQVRVHIGKPSEDAATGLGARAFTIGKDIHFAAGAYQPGTDAGDRLLAHEAFHAVKHGAAGPTSGELEISKPGDRTEVQAERFAARYVKSRSAGRSNAEPERSDTGTDQTTGPGAIFRFPGVIAEALEEDKIRGIDPGNPKSEKVWTPERGYIKNPTAVKLSDVIKDGKVVGKFANVKAQYVVDADGEVWIGVRSGQNMPHPTLIGGKDPQVRAAGTIEIQSGKVVRFDNASGHFRPPRASLRNAIKAMARLPKELFKGLSVESISHTAEGKEVFKPFRSLRLLKFKKVQIGPALRRIRMRYRHDPKFRGRLRSMGRGGAAIIVAIITQYLLGKWLADIESKQIQKDIEKLAPKVEAQLAESLASQADRFDDLLEADPDTEIHMNIVYRLGYWRDLDPEAGMTEAYGSAEFVKAEFSEKAAENGIRFDEIQYFSCGFASMRWDTFTVSEPIKVKDLAE